MKPPTSGLTASGPNAAAPPPKLNPDLDAVCARSFGNYPWDDWERHALARGLDADLAGLGRLLIREAFNHGWESWLQNLCGWGDDGRALLAFALRAPKSARRQWDILMRTDGLRGDYPARSTDWTWGFLRADARRLLDELGREARGIMAWRIPEADIERVKRSTDLRALVQSRGIELKKHGSKDWIGRCPFHADKDSPNFIVSPDKGLFHCMACGKAGNAIQFVEQHDGVSFRHAFELLAQGGTAAFAAAPLQKQATVPRLPCPLDAAADDAALFSQVAGVKPLSCPFPLTKHQ
jgi:hypothetical protein